jgi:hypothetical protein
MFCVKMFQIAVKRLIKSPLSAQMKQAEGFNETILVCTKVTSLLSVLEFRALNVYHFRLISILYKCLNI